MTTELEVAIALWEKPELDDGRLMPSLILAAATLREAARRVAETEEVWSEAELILQDIVSKAVPLGEDEDGFITGYLFGTGAIHRAIAYCQTRQLYKASRIDLASLRTLEARLTDGTFFSDYDADLALVGKLREALDALGRLLLPAEEEK